MQKISENGVSGGGEIDSVPFQILLMLQKCNGNNSKFGYNSTEFDTIRLDSSEVAVCEFCDNSIDFFCKFTIRRYVIAHIAILSSESVKSVQIRKSNICFVCFVTSY